MYSLMDLYEAPGVIVYGLVLTLDLWTLILTIWIYFAEPKSFVS